MGTGFSVLAELPVKAFRDRIALREKSKQGITPIPVNGISFGGIRDCWKARHYYWCLPLLG